MAKFETRLCLRNLDNYSKNKLLSMFEDLSLTWRVVGKNIVVYSKIQSMPYRIEEKELEELQISFVGMLPYNINIEGNYVTDSNSEDGAFWMLDDLYTDDIERYVIGWIFAIVLADPKININGCKVKVFFEDSLFLSRLYFHYSMQNYAASAYENIIKTDLSFFQCWKWLEKNSSMSVYNSKSPTYISALSYILSREFHECIIYSIIGLESIFVPRDKGAGAYLLRKRISTIFPGINGNQIKELYDARSKIVHGEVKLGLSFSDDEVMEDGNEFEKLAIFATAVLLETIRIMIHNNATEIKFQETITPFFT